MRPLADDETRGLRPGSADVPTDLTWVNLVHTWPQQERSRASRKASFRTLKSLACTGVLGTAILMTHTHRGIDPSATEDLVRKFA
jgi:hypothetical protein